MVAAGPQSHHWRTTVSRTGTGTGNARSDWQGTKRLFESPIVNGVYGRSKPPNWLQLHLLRSAAPLSLLLLDGSSNLRSFPVGVLEEERSPP
jgi:hypothetical protein